MNEAGRKAQGRRAGSETPPAGPPTQRLALAWGQAGWLLGLYEAASLRLGPYYSFPHMPVPDAGPMIWVLAPLAGLLAFGFMGLALGFAISKWGVRAESRIPTLLTSMGFGMAGAYAACILFVNYFPLRVPGRGARLLIPLVGWLVIFSISLLAFRLTRNRSAGSWVPRRQPLLIVVRNPLLLVLITAPLIAALVVSWLHGSTSSDPLPQARSQGGASGPNIVLITLDAVTASHLSCYGYARPTTPNLDRLASRGVLFENAIAPSSWTLASFSSMFTGRFPHQHGADFALPLANRFSTVAEVLKTRGYETAGFNANPSYGQASQGIGHRFEVYEDGSSTVRQNFERALVGRAFQKLVYVPFVRPDYVGRLSGHELNEEISRWYRRRTDRPFFLFVNYFDAHDPYLAPPPFENRFGTLPYRLVRRMWSEFNTTRVSRRHSPEEQGAVIAGYDNTLAYLDSEVEGLLRLLAASPDWSNTIVIVTADHGESFGEHGYYGHAWGLYRELLHVPLIIFGPGIPSGLRIAKVVSTLTLAGTVADLAEHREMPPGRYSLRRFWTSGTAHAPFEDVAVSELDCAPWNCDPAEASVSLTTSRWHYIQDSESRMKLFDWQNDPLEASNLAGAPEQSGVVRTMQRILEDRLQSSRRPWMGLNYLRAFAQSQPALQVGGDAANGASDGGPDQLSPESKDLLHTLPYQ